MKAVAVVPGKKELRLVDHPLPQISSEKQIKVKTLDVGICGTDREICTFVYGEPPSGDDHKVIGNESLGSIEEDGSGVNWRRRKVWRRQGTCGSLSRIPKDWFLSMVPELQA